MRGEKKKQCRKSTTGKNETPASLLGAPFQQRQTELSLGSRGQSTRGGSGGLISCALLLCVHHFKRAPSVSTSKRQMGLLMQ